MVKCKLVHLPSGFTVIDERANNANENGWNEMILNPFLFVDLKNVEICIEYTNNSRKRLTWTFLK